MNALMNKGKRLHRVEERQKRNIGYSRVDVFFVFHNCGVEGWRAMI